MIIFSRFWPLLKRGFIFWGSWGTSENQLELTTLPFKSKFNQFKLVQILDTHCNTHLHIHISTQTQTQTQTQTHIHRLTFTHTFYLSAHFVFSSFRPICCLAGDLEICFVTSQHDELAAIVTFKLEKSNLWRHTKDDQYLWRHDACFKLIKSSENRNSSEIYS